MRWRRGRVWRKDSQHGMLETLGRPIVFRRMSRAAFSMPESFLAAPGGIADVGVDADTGGTADEGMAFISLTARLRQCTPAKSLHNHTAGVLVVAMCFHAASQSHSGPPLPPLTGSHVTRTASISHDEPPATMNQFGLGKVTEPKTHRAPLRCDVCLEHWWQQRAVRAWPKRESCRSGRDQGLR